ncbi:CRISPR-associated protein, Cas2 family [Arenibacter nanhaiticus]|uniref:CRISPR-associated endoribonuclease Cas2 n=1 Tax=Arenibacter nanhaiticus TaxID=558155 RepID=A0A1M6JXI2_9FLAO|nr:CRISPR-associated endonuclease Cas2 [Arenibacter nanhaiticus]SHJ51341.1 CRISPR-associated protein, Cas2 family [Arenibacter nanhaiticus]
MITWVLYDIKNNAARSFVSKACKHAGLYRVQYSCFLGTLNANEKDSLELQIEKVINEESDKVYLFRMNKDQLKECRMLGQAFDEKLITDEIKALFF